MIYKTCVSIGEKTPKKISESLSKSLKKSDHAEIRFDFLNPELVPETLDMIKKDLKKCICTLRPSSEGGRFSGTEKNRISIIKLIAEYNPFLLDIEFNTIKKNKNLLRYLKSTNTDLLVSWHNFKQTPNATMLKKQYFKMKKFSNNIKIVTTAKTVNDIPKILSLYDNKNTRLIAFCMGDIGKVSRLLSLFFGSPFTYVSLGKPIAAGQLKLDELKSMLMRSG